MRKLYEKKEILFAVLWIVAYCVILGTIRGNFGVLGLVRQFTVVEKVWLSYEPENTRARDIYQKYGFVENGEMCGNEIVAVYEL